MSFGGNSHAQRTWCVCVCVCVCVCLQPTQPAIWFLAIKYKKNKKYK